MPQPVLPDPETQQYLDSARAQAAASLKGQMPDSMLTPPVAPAPGIPQPGVPASQPTEQPPVPETPDLTQTESAAPAPQPSTVPSEPTKYAQPTFAEDLGESAKQTGKEVANGFMRGSLALANMVGFAAATVAKVGGSALGVTGHPEDTVFDFLKKYVDTAYAYWQVPKEESNPYARIVGKVTEGLTPLLAAAPLGGAAAIGTFAGSAGVEAGKQSIERGEDVKTAALLAAIAAGASALQMKSVPNIGNVAKRIAASVGLGVTITTAASALTKKVLQSREYKEAAANIDPLDPEARSVDALMQVIFGVLGGPKPTAKGAAPKPSATPDIEAGPTPGAGEPPPPPGAPGPGAEPTALPRAQGATFNRGVTAEGAPVTPVDVSKPVPTMAPARAPAQPDMIPGPDGKLIPNPNAGIAPVTLPAANAGQLRTRYATPGEDLSATGAPIADKPSAEPLKDLRAQVADMKNPGTPRKGVYLSPDALDAYPPDTVKELADGGNVIKNFDQKGGALIVENQAERLKALALRKSEPDMQVVLGRLTGAGEGKTTDQTQVVQGHTPDGAVVTESSVAPADVAAKVEQVKAEGNTPVITTQGEAVARRADEITKQGEMPAAEAPKSPDMAGYEVRPAMSKSLRSSPEPGFAVFSPEGKVVSQHFTDRGAAERELEAAKAEIAKPVQETPTESNKVEPVKEAPVEQPKPVSDEQKLAESRARGAEQSAANKAAVAKAEGVPLEEIEQRAVAGKKMLGEELGVTEKAPLQQALDSLKAQETPPNGKRFPGKLPERVQWVSEFARALKAEAAKPGVPDAIAENANAVAKRAMNLDQKTPEAIAKNQGVGHTQLSEHVADLTRAAENILHPDKAVIERPAGAKVAQLKAKIERAREAPVKAAELKAKIAEKKAEPPKVKTAIKDVEDVTKPKQLTAAEQAKVSVAGKKYMESKGEETAKSHDALESMLHEIYGPDRPNEVTSLMEGIRGMRDERQTGGQHRPTRMSDTVDEAELQGRGEVEGHDEDYGDARDAGSDALEAQRREGYATSRAARAEWQGLHDRLGKFWDKMVELRDKGGQASAHKVLDYLLAHASEGTAVKEVLSKLRQFAPDSKILPQEIVIDAEGKADHTVNGLFTLKDRAIRLRVTKNDTPVTSTMAMVHEMVHSATAEFIRRYPTHPLTQELARLHEVLGIRLQGLVNEARTEGRVIFGMRPGETGVPRRGDFYGFKNVDEMMAETLTEPAFQQLVAESGRFARMVEGLRDVYHKVIDVSAKMLGLKKPGEVKLLHNIADVTYRVMEAQKMTSVEGGKPPAGGDLADLAKLREEPRSLPHERDFRDIVGDHATTVTRYFDRAIHSGAIDKIRKQIPALMTHSQIVRAALRRGIFGHSDDPTNPIRNYDEATEQRNAVIERTIGEARTIVRDRAKLSQAESTKLGDFQRDSTTYGIDPTEDKADLPTKVTGDPKFAQRWADFQARWNNLSPEQKSIYERERDWNEWALKRNRRAAIDAALDSFSEKDIDAARRARLYGVTDPSHYESLIGPGKMIDVADRNDHLVQALKELGGTHELQGPYFHLGRHGDYVVQVKPEGTKTFLSKSQAEAYAENVRGLSPGSKATVDNIGGKWQVDYKAEFVSMHENPAEATKAIEALRAQGFDVGSATTKLISDNNAVLNPGMQSLVAEVQRKLERNGNDASTQAQVDSLRTAFLHIMAAKSAYAGSKLARKNIGGVKGSEMGRNFAAHAQSLSWNTGNLGHSFKIGEAMGRVREAVKDADQPQATALARGRVYEELSKRIAQEASLNVGRGASWTGANSAMAKVGFLNYLTSISHTIVNLTQNFTTAIPVAISRHGPIKAMDSFGAAMKLVAGPSFRETMRALGFQSDAQGVQKAILAAVAKNPRFGKWATGDYPALQQMIDRGAVHSSFTNQLHDAAVGNGGGVWTKTMNYARLVPAYADVFNRITTALAGLELHGGDVRKAGDFVRETHMDYTTGERPRLFREVSRVPGGNSVVMFKTYMQGMAHLLYSHIYDAASGKGEGGRTQALTTVAGVMLGASLFAGIQRGMGLEPLRLLMYAYNKLAGDNDEYHNFDNSSRRWVRQVTGNDKVADVINGGLPRTLGFDMSSRLGLSDLFFHDPPDVLSADSTTLDKLAAGILGPVAELLVSEKRAVYQALATGRVDDALRVLPVKFVHNIMDAYQFGTAGKVSSSGAHLTSPSGWAALTKAAGFKTAEEAKVSEKTNTVADYKQWAENRKYQYIKAWVAADSAHRQDIWDSIRNFNADNPAHRIAYQDLLKQMRAVGRQESTASGLPTRDPNANELVNY